MQENIVYGLMEIEKMKMEKRKNIVNRNLKNMYVKIFKVSLGVLIMNGLTDIFYDVC